MMNRQIRRAQRKQDIRTERERERKKEARREKIRQLREQRVQRREELKAARSEGRSPSPSAGADSTGAQASGAQGGSKRKPGRFAGALMMATVFFIVLNSAVTPEEATGNDLLRTITSAGFYLLFGYFSVLWLMRRSTPRPVIMTLVSGAFLTIGVEVAKRFQTEPTTDLLMLALAVPGLVAGALLGRAVYVHSPG